MKFSLFAAFAAIAGFSLFEQSQNATLKAHSDALKSAKSLVVTFTVARLPGAPVACTLSYSKPNSYRIETPDKLIVCDGKTLTELNKTDNTYSEADAGSGRPVGESVWAWAAFFDGDPFKDATSVTAGAKRSIKGSPVSEVAITLSPSRSATLFIDNKTGIARGASFKVNTGAETVETLALASDLKIDAEALPDSTFAFQAPAGAKKAEKPKVEAVSYSKVDGIFQSQCVTCHNQSNPKSGLDLTTYAGAMAGGRGGKIVVPGDPANSKLLGVLNGTMSPRMPKNAPPLSEEAVKTVSDWIASGAKEN